MVLPIYNVMAKIDENLIEAAYDLGASKAKVFSSVILPLSVPGIASGITMVFVPSLTTFAISNMLGGGKVNLIGNIIEQEFTTSLAEALEHQIKEIPESMGEAARQMGALGSIMRSMAGAAFGLQLGHAIGELAGEAVE